MLKAVIFDMDGVLVNSEPVHYQMYEEYFKEKGSHLPYEVYRLCIGSTKVYLQQLITEAGLDVSIVTAEADERVKYHELAILERDGYPPIAGVKEFVKDLHENGILLAIASSSPQERIIRTAKELGLYEYFDQMVSGEDVPNPKPAPDVFLKAMRMLGVKPDECVIVEDSRNGSIAAKASGASCIGFYNPDSGEQDLSAADVIVEGFEELDTAFAERIWCRTFGQPWTLGSFEVKSESETDTVVIRELGVSDREAVCALCGRVGNVSEFLSDPEFITSEEYFAEYVHSMYAFYDFGMYGLFLNGGKLIGLAGLAMESEEETGLGIVTLGYVTAPEYRRRGIAMKACEKVCGYAVQTLELDEIVVRVSEQNIGSLALARALAKEQTALQVVPF